MFVNCKLLARMAECEKAHITPQHGSMLIKLIVEFVCVRAFLDLSVFDFILNFFLPLVNQVIGQSANKMVQIVTSAMAN